MKSGCVANERLHAGGHVLKAGGVVKERIISVGGVRAAGGVQEKGARSLRRVEVAGRIATEGGKTNGGIEVAGCVATKGGKTDGRVAGARGKREERIITLCGIATGVAPSGAGTTACIIGDSARPTTAMRTNMRREDKGLIEFVIG